MQVDTSQHAEFLAVLRQCEGTLLKVCFLFTDRRRDDFRDLYQDIVCTLWESWPTFRGDSSVNTWVTRIALNVAGQELRKRKRLPQFVRFDESFYDTLADEATDSLYRQLYHLIDLLDDEDRKYLYLYLDRKTHREIAAITGHSENAVRQRIHRIKQKLYTLKQQEDE